MAGTEQRHPAPKGLHASGRRLWRSIADQWQLDEHESAILREAARTVDLIDQLHELAQADGLVIVGGRGGQVSHPALAEARQQRVVLARLLAVLRVPTGDEDDPAAGRRPQRRAGARGTYGIQGVAR
ncbi:hypothetical protein ACQPX6_10260 [Actinomycetospora sp. CA-101289]|uniref:hypothetical protein n=1 Tax=Actinomycetospora sp. CA-101289 TaxID=3239893 RepID=UPI003D953F10